MLYLVLSAANESSNELGRALPGRTHFMRRKPKLKTPNVYDLDLPSWMDASSDRTTPYTEKELDDLVDGALNGIQDTTAWQDLVDQVGEAEAGAILRLHLNMRDENARKLFRH